MYYGSWVNVNGTYKDHVRGHETRKKSVKMPKSIQRTCHISTHCHFNLRIVEASLHGVGMLDTARPGED